MKKVQREAVDLCKAVDVFRVTLSLLSQTSMLQGFS